MSPRGPHDQLPTPSQPHMYSTYNHVAQKQTAREKSQAALGGLVTQIGRGFVALGGIRGKLIVGTGKVRSCEFSLNINGGTVVATGGFDLVCKVT